MQPLEKLVIHQRVGEISGRAMKQRAIRTHAKDDMLGLDIEHAKSVLTEVLNDAQGYIAEEFFGREAFYYKRLGSLNCIQAVDPAVEQNVQTRRFQLYFRMPCTLGGHFTFQAAGLPILQPRGRHVNSERFLGKHAGAPCQKGGCTERHHQGEFLERTIELGMGIFANELHAERNFLAKPAETDDQIK